MTTQKTKDIREACVRANPEIMEKCWRCKGSGYLQNSLERAEGLIGSIVCNESFCEDGEIVRPLHLEDILLALKKKRGETPLTLKKVYKSDTENKELIWLRWNLKADFDHQSEPTKNFIWELLYGK